MPSHAVVAHGAIGSRRDHGGIPAMQPPIALCGWLGRCPTARKATRATSRMRLGNSLFQPRIRESLTTFDLILPDQGRAAGVHVGVVFQPKRISAVKPSKPPLGASGNKGEQRTGD